ncbi:MAG: acyl-CoA dehydrogenase family protein [Acidimicrobiales bacterium]
MSPNMVSSVPERIRDAAIRAGERAQEIEQGRQLPADLVADIASTGAFKLTVAKTFGGSQAPMQDVLDAIELFSYHDGASGWCVMIANTTATLSGWIDPIWAEQLFGPDNAIGGGHAAPQGRGIVVDGGIRVTGKWEWGSGSSHCTAMAGGVFVVDDEGAPAKTSSGASVMLAFFDDDDVELLDTWHVAGMKGTASTDYRVTDAFVPEGRWADVVPLNGGTPLVDDPLYHFPFYGNFAVSVAAVMLGLAARAVDELALLGEKKPANSRRSLSDKSAARSEIASADAAVRMARALMREAVGDAWQAAQDGTLNVEHRRLLRLAASAASERCQFAIATCFGTAGGTAVYETSPLQRVQRDAMVAAQHAMIGRTQLERVGALQFGAEIDLRGF